MRIMIAASTGGASTCLRDIASASALTPELFKMRSVTAVNAVLAALGKTAVGGLDLPSLKVAGCDFACCRAAGFDLRSLRDAGFTAADVIASGCDPKSAHAAGFDILSLLALFGYDACIIAGCDLRFILVSRSAACIRECSN
jgi:hypothetical protein